MSIYEGDPSDPLYSFATQRDAFDEIMETVRSVLISGPTWKYYRLDVMKCYLPDGKYDYLVLAFVEDRVEAERAGAAGTVARGHTRYWTRWTTFPEVRGRSAAAVLREAMQLLADRVR